MIMEFLQNKMTEDGGSTRRFRASEQRVQELHGQLSQVESVRRTTRIDPRVLALQEAAEAGRGAGGGGGQQQRTVDPVLLERELAYEAAQSWGSYRPEELQHEGNSSLFFHEVHRGRKTENNCVYGTKLSLGRKTLEEAMIGDLTKPMTVHVRVE